MKQLVTRLIELTRTSATAIADAGETAHKTYNNLRWFQVVETGGNTEKSKGHYWQ